MPSKKPKPATAGEKIADTTTTALSRRKDPTRIMEWNAEMDRLSHRIDRAIARAVRNERERCGQIVLAAHLSRGSRWDAYQKIRDDTEREPER